MSRYPRTSTEFYVYLHKRATDGKVFYVGKGSGTRARQLNNRNRAHKSIVNKYGVEIEIYASGLQEWYAYELEMQLISLYGRRDLKEGYLINFSDGGEGGQSNPSRERRKKLSEATKERLKDKDFSERNNKHLRNNLTTEKWRLANDKMLEKKRRRVIMDESICFRSIRDAAFFLGAESHGTCIYQVCNNELGANFCQGHIFRYLEQDPEEFYSIREARIESSRKNKIRGASERNSKVYLLNGNLIKGLKNVAAKIGCSTRSVYEAVKEGWPFQGNWIEEYKEEIYGPIELYKPT